MNLIRQTMRGCGSLPHVGEHPGTLWLVVMLAASVVAGGLGGLAIMAACLVPAYLYGAYQRAELSDRISRRGR